jgi:hypothetical protein
MLHQPEQIEHPPVLVSLSELPYPAYYDEDQSPLPDIHF